jgi:hypothetical protein
MDLKTWIYNGATFRLYDLLVYRLYSELLKILLLHESKTRSIRVCGIHVVYFNWRLFLLTYYFLQKWNYQRFASTNIFCRIIIRSSATVLVIIFIIADILIAILLVSGLVILNLLLLSLVIIILAICVTVAMLVMIVIGIFVFGSLIVINIFLLPMWIIALLLQLFFLPMKLHDYITKRRATLDTTQEKMIPIP